MYAEECNYFDTPVQFGRSSGEIADLLEDFGATDVVTANGHIDGTYAYLVRFEWNGKYYRFKFQPLTCKYPDKIMTYSGKKRTNLEQAKYQMGRIAFYFVKAILTAAAAQPAALFGFMELPVPSADGVFYRTAGELELPELANISGIKKLMAGA